MDISVIVTNEGVSDLLGWGVGGGGWGLLEALIYMGSGTWDNYIGSNSYHGNGCRVKPR